MLEYENMKGLLKFLQMKNYPHKHQCDNIDQSMAEIMHDIFKATIMEVMNATNYISIFCDETTNVDIQS